MEKRINNINDIGNRTPFTVPGNYFAQFNEEMLNRLPAKKATTAKKATIWDKAKPWVYMAAMFIGLFFSIRILTTNIDKENTQTTHLPVIQNTHADNYWSNVSISEEEFYQYLEDQMDSQVYYDFLYDEIYPQSL